MTLRHNDVRVQIAADNGRLFAESFQDNPLLTGAAGATLIAAGCTTLSNALILSLFMLVNLPLAGVIACKERERMDSRLRPALYAAVCSATVFLLSLLLDNVFPDSVTALGIYAPLAAMNGLVMHRTWQDARILLAGEAVVEGLACALCFALIALPVAFVRELLGSGTLLGSPVGLNGAEALQSPFFGFILCGMLIALVRALTGKGGRT